MAQLRAVKCDDVQSRIDRFFQDLNEKALDAIRGHVGGCHDCRSRYAALYMAEVTLGERKVPVAAGGLLNEADRERLVEAVTDKRGSPPPPKKPGEGLRTGLWLSIVLGAVALALLVLLIQGPTPTRGKRLATMRSKAPVAVDLYCVAGDDSRFLIPFEGSCATRLEIEYRNREAKRLHLSFVEVQGQPTDQPTVRALVQNFKMPSTDGAIQPMGLRPVDMPSSGPRQIFAFLGSNELSREELLDITRMTLEGQPPTHIRVRSWRLAAEEERN